MDNDTNQTTDGANTPLATEPVVEATVSTGEQNESQDGQPIASTQDEQVEKTNEQAS